MKLKPQFRNIEVKELNKEDRSITLSFSSEEPYERYWGVEILSHEDGAVDFSRLNNSAPLLFNHDRDIVVGVVERAWIEGKRGYAKVRFGNSKKAKEVYEDVKDNILKNVSVGYEIQELKLIEEKNDIETYKVVKWLPLEVSIVTIPADNTVGVGRSLEEKEIKIRKEVKMGKETKSQEETQEQRDPKQAINVKEIESEARKAELARVREVMAIGEQFNKKELATKAINEGTGVDEFRAKILDELKGATAVSANTAEIGLSKKEAKEFSFVRALNALANPQDRKAQEDASFEFEVSRATAQKMGKTPTGILVPVDVLKRDLDTTAGSGSIDTVLKAGSFIEMLRNKAIMLKMATMLSGLVGDVAIPKQTGGATAYWLDEGASPTESQGSIGQIGLTPKTVGAYTDITRKLLKQSSVDVESFVRNDIAKTLALAIDKAIIQGQGTSGEPLGILNTTGVSVVALGDDGGEPTFGAMVDLETEVAVDNADVNNMKYVTNARGRGKLKKTAIESGQTAKIWDKNMINGYEALATNQIPGDLTKGNGTNLSAMLFGNFADLIVGMWGGLDLNVDPYSNSTSGTLRVVGLQDVDVVLRRSESFAVIKDMITT